MSRNYIISCGSTTDLPYSYMCERGIPVIFYTYAVDGVVHEDNMSRDPGELTAFYDIIAAGKLPTTSQLNEEDYRAFFVKQLDTGKDLLHIAFGSGMSGSVNNAMKAAEALRSEYPERRITVIDSTCSCMGYGLFVDYTADLRDSGASMEEVEEWIEANKRHVQHQFFSPDLQFFRRSGRMTGVTATIGSILNICPIMHLNYDGCIVAYDKVIGKKNAIRTTVDNMEQHAKGGTNYDGKCFICHANSPTAAAQMKAMIQERFPKLPEVRVNDIGPIIASHCGPGTVSLYFMGDERIKDS